jgi:hypothetical protein
MSKDYRQPLKAGRTKKALHQRLQSEHDLANLSVLNF